MQTYVTNYVTRLPCGCHPAGNGRLKETRVLRDGTRVCIKHGRRWSLQWLEMPSEMETTPEQKP